MRKADTAEIFIGVEESIAESPERFGFNPTIDGHGGLLPDIASKFINSGRFARLPFMAGTNLDEGSYYNCKTLFIYLLTISPFFVFFI